MGEGGELGGATGEGGNEAGNYTRSGKEDAPRTMRRRVMCSDNRLGEGDELGNAGGALLEGREKGSEIGDGGACGGVEANAIVRCRGQAVLEVSEEAVRPREGRAKGTEFAKVLTPGIEGEATEIGGFQVGEDGLQAGGASRAEAECHGVGVEEPP